MLIHKFEQVFVCRVSKKKKKKKKIKVNNNEEAVITYMFSNSNESPHEYHVGDADV